MTVVCTFQVQPGDWDINVRARATAPLVKVVAPALEEPWPGQEIWSFEAQSWLRVSGANGDQPIDPAQAGVPEDWRGLPAFALAPEAALTIEERSRGLSGEDANRLTLQREVWLQFDGAALYAKDRIGGTMHRDWRLDMTAPYVLERAQSRGEGLLVTKSTDGATGVEMRESVVDLGAGVRVARDGKLPVAGWRQSFDSINWRLHLPYSYRLLAAPGADRAAGSWISSWTLLDVFLVAITALLAARLLGWTAGAIALGYLVLGYHEAGAPLWTLLIVVVLGLIAKALPLGRLRSVMQIAATAIGVLLAIIALPFVAQQVRYTLYPQLETGYGSAPVAYDMFADGNVAGGAGTGGAGTDGPVERGDGTAAAARLGTDAAGRGAAGIGHGHWLATSLRTTGEARAEAGRFKALQYQNNLVQRYAQNTVIQAGRGEPSWSYGRVYDLSWSGPVLADQDVRLLISPPWLTRLLRVLMLGLLIATLLALAKRLVVSVRRASTGSGQRRRDGLAAGGAARAAGWRLRVRRNGAHCPMRRC